MADDYRSLGPGWQATVNGRPREVLGADFIFRAVQVDAGDNQVTLEYKPRGQFVCLAISWGTLARVRGLRNTPKVATSRFRP